MINSNICVTFQLYDNLRRMDPDFKRKVQVVLGDILEENLGLKPEDVDLLNREINIVFHSAATIRFDEPLRWGIYFHTDCFNSLLDRRFGWDFGKAILVIGIFGIFMTRPWKLTDDLVSEHSWHWFNGLMPSGTKPLPEPILTKMYVNIWRHKTTISELIHVISAG